MEARISLSLLSFSHLCPLTCLSLLCFTCLSTSSLSTCAGLVFCPRDEWKGKERVSHPVWLSVRRDLPPGHISSRQTETERRDKGNIKEEGQVSPHVHKSPCIHLFCSPSESDQHTWTDPRSTRGDTRTPKVSCGQ